jgi:hypothetical protein
LIGADTGIIEASRYYDASGNLTRRIRHETNQGTMTNPVTGLSVTTTQRATFDGTMSVPGYLGTEIVQMTGVVKFYLPGAGVLVRDVGITILLPGDNVLWEAGQHNLDVYYGSGDTSVMTALCSALGSPGTP